MQNQQKVELIDFLTEIRIILNAKEFWDIRITKVQLVYQ